MEVKIHLPDASGEKQQFNFWMDTRLHARLMSEAKKRGVPAAEFVRHVLRQVLPDHEREAA